MNWQPLSDRVFIIRDVEPQKGLIFVPEVAQTKGIKGTVVAVGPKVDFVKVGDRVLFGSQWNDLGDNYQNTGYSWDDKLHLVQQADIYGILND